MLLEPALLTYGGRYADVCTETPEPWNNGFDALNFEFMAQPPPGQQQQPQSGYYF